MNNLLVTLKYESQLNTCTATNYTNGELVHEIITLLRQGNVAIGGWARNHHIELNTDESSDDPILLNHTLMEVRFEIYDSPDEQENIEWLEGNDTLLNYVIEALEMGEPEVTCFSTKGEAPMQKSVIGIEIHPAY